MGGNIVDEIKSRCNIVDVIGRYVNLKRSGSGYMGLCPFHGEKTPSFSVSESKQFYNCFGCGEHGDVISFVMKKENVDFQTAVSKLAEEYHIDMDQYGFRNESKKKRIYEMNRDAARFFFKNLTSRANPGYSYITGRGLDAATIKKFGLGYAADSWDDLTSHLSSLGYDKKMMADSGLVSYNREKNRYYDKFRNRLIFPIFNTSGKVIGFGGRDLGDRGPKYLNSPESAVFSKKNNLFGLNITRDDISKENCVIMVEGYMDLVSLYKNGVTNVAASLGTALTDNQCQLLKRYTENVVLSYDADSAGRKAALRGIELLNRAGLKARVMHVTDGKDPDEFIKKHGRLAFMDLVENALPYADYRIASVRIKYDLKDQNQSLAFLKEVSRVLADLSPVEAEFHISRIARETGISEGAVRREVNALTGVSGADAEVLRIRSDIRTDNTDKSTLSDERDNSGSSMLQRLFIRLLTVNPEYMTTIRDYGDEFTDPAYFSIFREMKTMYEEEQTIDIRRVADALEPEVAGLLQDITDKVLFPADPDRVLAESIESVRKKRLEERKSELRQMIDMLGDDPRADEAFAELMKLEKS